MVKICCGFGGRDTSYDIVPQLRECLEQAIELGCDTFYLGNYGNFDHIMSRETRILKEKYPHIKRVLVIPYATKEIEMNRMYYETYYDCIILPDKARTVHPKFAIPKKNEWVIDNSDVVITCPASYYGGSRRAEEYAQKKNKIILPVK